MNALLTLLTLLALLCFLAMGASVHHIAKDWGRTLFNISATVFTLTILLLCIG